MNKVIYDHWSQIRLSYKLEEMLGFGTFGVVYSATSIKTGKKVAIKLVKDIQSSEYMARKVLRELIILRKFSQIETNVFTSKVMQVILPNDVEIDSLQSKETKIDVAHSDLHDISKLTHLFIVMEHEEMDLKNILD